MPGRGALLVEGRRFDGAASGSISFNVVDAGSVPIDPFTGTAMTLGPTISGTIGEYTVTADIHVSGYTEEQVDAGEARYHLEDGTGDRVACASCHLAAGGADHTPTEMAFHDDAAICAPEPRH